MRPLLLALAVLAALAAASAHAYAEPLVCVDPGATEIEDVITVDPPEVCIL